VPILYGPSTLLTKSLPPSTVECPQPPLRLSVFQYSPVRIFTPFSQYRYIKRRLIAPSRYSTSEPVPSILPASHSQILPHLQPLLLPEGPPTAPPLPASCCPASAFFAYRRHTFRLVPRRGNQYCDCRSLPITPGASPHQRTASRNIRARPAKPAPPTVPDAPHPADSFEASNTPLTLAALSLLILLPDTTDSTSESNDPIPQPPSPPLIRLAGLVEFFGRVLAGNFEFASP